MDVNKCESVDSGMLQAADFWALGLDELYPVSAIHESGTVDLLDDIFNAFPHQDVGVYEYDDDDGIINMAIVERPNVRKSSLLNMLPGEQLAIVSSEPGTTRHVVDEEFVPTLPFADDDELLLNECEDETDYYIERDDNGLRIRRYRLIDTTRIDPIGSIEISTEFFMINRSFRAIRRADVVLLLLDVTKPSEQCRKIVDRVRYEGKVCIMVDKWYLIPSKTNRSYNSTMDDVSTRGRCVVFRPSSCFRC